MIRLIALLLGLLLSATALAQQVPDPLGINSPTVTPTFLGLNLVPNGRYVTGLDVEQIGSGTRDVVGNHLFNVISVNKDNIQTDPALPRDQLSSALYVGQVKNEAGNVQGGFQTLWAYGELNKPTPNTNRNRNYVAVTAEAVSRAGDGGMLTTLASPAIAGATTLTVTSASNLVDGTDPFFIRLDNGQIHLTKIVGAPVGASVTIETGLPSAAAAGKQVYAPRGAVFATNPWAHAIAGENLLNLTGGEVNVEMPVGTSVFYKAGLVIAANPADRVQGQVYDCMLCLSGNTGSIGWGHGILFGNMNGQTPLAAGGILLGIDNQRGAPMDVGIGFDLTYAVFGKVLQFNNGLWHGNGSLGIGANNFTFGPAELGMTKVTASGTAPGAAKMKFGVVAGTTGGTCKLIAYAGTSTTPTTIIDNVGAGC